MFNTLLRGIVTRGASYLVAQAFVNQLRLLCQQAYYNTYPYNRDVIHQQIAAAIYNAFNSVPVYQHEQAASNLLSALVNCPFQAADLRLLGPQECARRYPIYAPVIYAVADVLMPGWRQVQQTPYIPLTGTYESQQPAEATYSQPYSQPVPSSIASTPSIPPSPWTTYGQATTSPRPAFVSQEPAPRKPPLPLRPALPPRAQRVTQTPIDPLVKDMSPSVDSLCDQTGPKSAVLSHSPSYQSKTNVFDAPFDVEAFNAKTAEEKRAFKQKILADAVKRGADLDRKMEEILTARRNPGLKVGESSAGGGLKSTAERELLDKAKQRDDFMRAAANVVQNPGMNAAELGHVLDPLRDHIRDMVGEGIVDQLDAVLGEQAAQERKKTDLYGGSLRSGRNEEVVIKDNGNVQVHQEADQVIGAATITQTTWSSGDSDKDGKARLERGLGSSNEASDPDDKMAIQLRRIREDRFHARWEASRKYVESLTAEERAHPDIAVEVGRTLFAQGWVNKSREAVDVSLSRWQDSWPGNHVSLKALRLLAAFLDVICDYKVKEALEIALAVRKIDEDVGAVATFSPIEVAAEIFHYKIMQQALAEGFLDEEIFQPVLLTRLRAVALRLREEGRIHDALSISFFLSDKAESRQESEAILRQYLDDRSLVPLDQADVCLELADVFAEAKEVSEAEKFLCMAEALFKKEGHVEGELKVRLKRLVMVDRKTAREVQAMLDLADEFANLSSATGGIMALGRAQSAALHLHPKLSEMLEAHERIQNLCAQTGNRFVQLQDSFTFSAALILWPEHIGKATESLSRFVKSTVDDLPKTKGRVAIFLGQAYLILGDRQKGLKYAKLGVRAFRHGHNHEAWSDATWGLASAMTNGDVGVDFLEAVKMLEESAKLDERHKYVGGQVRAYETLVTLEGMLALSDSTGYHQSRRDHWAAERQKINAESSRRDRIDKIRLLITQKEFDKAEELAGEALEIYLAEMDSVNVAVCRGLLFSCRFRPFDLSLPRSPNQLLKVADILVHARKAIQAYEELGPSGVPVPFIIELSLAFEEVGRYVPERKSALYSEALRYLALGEAVCESMRKDLPSLSGLPALLQKRLLVGFKYHQEIYTRALRLAAAMGDAEQVWNWTQKSKAKALSDMVASRFVSPSQIPAQDIKDDEAVALLEEESRLMKALESASDFECISIRRKLDELRVRMEGRSALGHLLGSRAGKIELQDLGWVFDSPAARCIPGKGEIVLVDWVVIDDAIVMLTVDRNLVPHMTTLSITWAQLRLWKRRNLVSEEPLNDIKTYKEQLEEINGLVAPLEKLAAKGDFLVFCPSVDLHSIPLHALKVGGSVLIVRNFVTYTTSLSLLRLCCERARGKLKAKSQANLDSFRAAFFASYEDETEKVEKAERTGELPEGQKVYKNVTQLAAEFGSAPHLGRDTTRENFQEAARNADVLHFHGHMDYHHNNVLHQALVLSNGGGSEETVSLSESPQRRTNKLHRRHKDLFTVGDIFSLRLDASIATMVACSSGVQDVSPGDEPLGLLAALQYAGCATCVGTLWPVNSADGRFLSLAFYQDLCQRLRLRQTQDGHGDAEIESQSPSPLNLAVSFCRAVRLLKKDENKKEGREKHYLPYHWAAFVMHGAWFL